STSPPSAVKRSGRTHPTAIRKHRPISGGADTTSIPRQVVDSEYRLDRVVPNPEGIASNWPPLTVQPPPLPRRSASARLSRLPMVANTSGARLHYLPCGQ